MDAQLTVDTWLTMRRRMPLIHVVGSGASPFAEEFLRMTEINAVEPFLHIHDEGGKFGDAWLPKGTDACRLEDALMPMISSVWLVAIGGEKTFNDVLAPLAVWHSVSIPLALMVVPPSEPSREDFDAMLTCVSAARAAELRPAIKLIKPDQVHWATWRLFTLMSRSSGLPGNASLCAD